jgi:predicted acyltransferase
METTATSQISASPAAPSLGSAEASKPVSKRLTSLDAFRGWTMFWIVGGGAIMTGLQALGHNPVIDTIIYQLNHTPWQGLRYYDLIWPSFMLMTGMSLPFSYAKRSLAQTHREIFLRVFRRALVLFLLGSIRESVNLRHPYLVELSSALQPIGIAYFFAFLLVRKSWRFQAAVGASILAGYALLLAFVPAPGVPAGSYQQGRNLVAAVDIAVLGRTHEEGWGTVLSTIPTIATTILGLLIGELLRSNRSQKDKIRVMALVGVSCVVLGLAMDPIVPVIMKLWTTSYGLASAGWACLLFLAFYLAIDVGGHRKWTFPFVVIGMNAVTVYMGRTLVPLGRVVDIFTAGPAATIGSFGPLFQAAAVLVVEWLILYWMFKRKIFLAA